MYVTLATRTNSDFAAHTGSDNHLVGDDIGHRKNRALVLREKHMQAEVCLHEPLERHVGFVIDHAHLQYRLSLDTNFIWHPGRLSVSEGNKCLRRGLCHGLLCLYQWRFQTFTRPVHLTDHTAAIGINGGGTRFTGETLPRATKAAAFMVWIQLTELALQTP